MNEQRRVETVEEFKLRIAAIIGDAPSRSLVLTWPRVHSGYLLAESRAYHVF